MRGSRSIRSAVRARRSLAIYSIIPRTCLFGSTNARKSSRDNSSTSQEPAVRTVAVHRTLRHVRGGLAAVLRELEAGSLEPKKANARIYGYRVLAGVMAAA